MVNLLIDNNANVNIASNDGSTPLHVAYKKGDFKTDLVVATRRLIDCLHSFQIK